MVRKSRPHAGSKGFYPRKRAAKETPGFSTFKPEQAEAKECRPLNFLVYKAGMTHVMGRDAHAKGTTFGQEIALPVTVLEAPSLKVFGARAYKKINYGTQPLMEISIEKPDKEFERRQHSFKKHGKKKREGKKAPVKQKTIEDFEAAKAEIVDLKLLAYSRPKETGLAKKKPDVLEIALSGSIDAKIAFAREKIGKEISLQDVFRENDFVDAKAVTTGKGTQGPVKRFGIKIQGRKAKRTRAVGSIGPWHPNTLMWQVARSGQTGYQNRTELNKKIVKISAKPEEISEINPASGFKNYGLVQTNFLLIGGSVPGPVKRAIGLRHSIRAPSYKANRHKLEGIDFIATSRKASKIHMDVSAQKIKLEEEKKVEKKSVADEIASAVKGEKK
ncbi:MAG: 50S ribosomal protein L3 [Candidatus ainarchaeum sp.]|nr:50S ribosomal protein L3 [Candidatus ainarchaeum sp.]